MNSGTVLAGTDGCTTIALGTRMMPATGAISRIKLKFPHRELVWVIFGQISSGCLLLLLSLWACGQRACVVHHVHSDAGCSSRGFVTRPWPAEPPTGSIGNDGRMPEIATGSAACR